MSKKDYILKLLDLLKNTWPMASGLRILVEGNALDDNSIDGLISIVENAIDSVENELSKEKLEKSKDFLQKLKKAEMASQGKDEQELNNLDMILASI
jgi:hypothetical protein